MYESTMIHIHVVMGLHEYSNSRVLRLGEAECWYYVHLKQKHFSESVDILINIHSILSTC